MDWPITTLLGASGLAFVIGILTGAFGIGGGFVLTPGLMILFSIPPATAVGTNLATVLTNSSFGLYKRRGSKTVDGKLALTVSAGTCMGVLAGSYLLDVLERMPQAVLLGRQHDPAELVLLLLFALLLLWIALHITWDTHRTEKQDDNTTRRLLGRLRIPPTARFSTVGQGPLSIPLLIVLGAMVGILAGLMGIGGIVLLPALIYLAGQDAREAAGTSLVLVWFAALIGVMHRGWMGHISVSLWAVMIAGGLTGTYVGTYIGLKVAGEKLKAGFLGVVLLALVAVGGQMYGMLFR